MTQGVLALIIISSLVVWFFVGAWAAKLVPILKKQPYWFRLGVMWVLVMILGLIAILAFGVVHTWNIPI